MAPDPPKTPLAHHPHHPGLKPHVVTAAEYEARLGKDINGNPLPKPKGKKVRAGVGGEPDKAVRQSQAAEEPALAAGWVKKFDASKGKTFYLNAAKHAVTWKRSVAEKKGAVVKKVPLAAGWVKKFDASKGKNFYVNPAKHAITWNRPGSERGSKPDAKLDARLARDLVHQPHFKHPNARNPTYEGSGQELDEALNYNARAVERAKEYYARIEDRRNLHANTSQKKSTLTKLGSRAFFKFDPIKGSFYKYSPDHGAVAKPGSVADTLAKVAASAKTPTISVNSGPALPSGDIQAAARALPKQHFTQKAQAKSVEVRHKSAKQDSALLNVARSVAFNAGYQPAAQSRKAKVAGQKKSPKKGKTATRGNAGKEADAKADDKNTVSQDESQADAVGDVVAGKSADPDWQARR